MCYYNGQKVAKAEHIRLKHLEKAVAKYDFLDRILTIGFDYSLNAVLKPIEGEKDFDIVPMEWGFLPSFWKTREDANKYRQGFKNEQGAWVQYLTLNAMCEEMLLPKKIYRQSALSRRCLVLSTGFFEWRHVFPIGKKTGKPLKTAVKYPYYITLKDREYFFMAGIWTPWTDQVSGEHVESFAIVTTAANSLMEQIHNTKKRMPTILIEDLAYEWLFGDPDEKRIAEIAATQYPSEQMEACSIAKDFRDVLEPTRAFEYEDLPALELAL